MKQKPAQQPSLVDTSSVLVRFGNPILRSKAQRLSTDEITSSEVQSFIHELRKTIATKDFGVGLAAPQLGKSLAIAVIDIKPTKNRPNLEPFSMVIINPQYTGIGRRSSKWEGCLSTGTGENTLFGKALRYSKIKTTWRDESGKLHEQELSGMPAHVFQHETDHLNGILFVDCVRDTKTYMLASEYRKRILNK